MEQIKSSAQFGALVKELKKTHGKLQSNCFFLPGEVEEMARKGKLYYQKTETGLYFLVTEEACSRLYYYIDADRDPDLSFEDWSLYKKAVILDYVFRGDEEAALEKAGCAKWLAKGFRPYKRYRRMECSKEGFCPPEDYVSSTEKYPAQKLTPGDYEEVSALWKKSLDVYSTFLLEKEEFTASCGKGELMGMRLPDGRIFAVAMAVKKGRTAFLQHLSVEPALRGKGIGKAMYCEVVWFALGMEGISKANFWVDEANSRAIGMYIKGGFVNDGTVSSQFILEKGSCT